MTRSGEPPESEVACVFLATETDDFAAGSLLRNCQYYKCLSLLLSSLGALHYEDQLRRETFRCSIVSIIVKCTRLHTRYSSSFTAGSENPTYLSVRFAGFLLVLLVANEYGWSPRESGGVSVCLCWCVHGEFVCACVRACVCDKRPALKSDLF